MVVAENGVTQEFLDQFVESDRTSLAILTATKEGGEHIAQCCCVHASVTAIKNFASFS